MNETIGKIEAALCHRETIAGSAIERVPPRQVEYALGRVAVLRREVARMERELELAQSATEIVRTTSANLQDVIRDRDLELEILEAEIRRLCGEGGGE